MALEGNLSRLIKTIEEDPGHDIEEIHEMIMDCSATELRGQIKLFTKLCHVLTEALIKTSRSVGGINLLSMAILKFQSRTSQLTPIHADLCLLCLDSKCLKPALKLLEIEYTDIRKLNTDKEEDVKQYLLFYYYGGLIYTALKDFEKASFYFEVVLTIPASHMSPIMQETYKKQIILSLLISGRVSDNLLPKYTSPCVFRQRKQVAQPYLKLANEYSSLNYESIQQVIRENAELYEKDENMGLINQCLTQVHKRNIQRLTKTFLTLALKDVADHVGLASEREAETYIVNMIGDGEIFATINQKDGMVVFHDNPENYESVTVFQKLQENMSTSMALIETLKKLHVDTSPNSDSKVNLKAYSELEPSK